MRYSRRPRPQPGSDFGFHRGIHLLLLLSLALWTVPDTAEAQSTQPGWEVSVLFDGSRKLNRRVRTLFLQRQGGELEAPILGSRVLGFLRDRGLVGEWPGLPESWLQRPDPDRDEPSPPEPAWTAAFEESGPRVFAAPIPAFLPFLPNRKALPLGETIWALREQESGELDWALATGTVRGPGRLSWDAYWNAGVGDPPTDFWDARKRIPHPVVRHARARYRPWQIWEPVQMATGTASSIRYNRVEGGSLMLPVRVNLSSTFHLHAWARASTSSYPLTGGGGAAWDYWPTTLGVDAYRRLEDANRWEPAERKRGNSLNAFLFGRDDGHYYTAEGFSLWAERSHGINTWRIELFQENDRTALPRVDHAVFPGDSLDTGPGLEAEDGQYAGARFAIEHQRGLVMEDGILVSNFWVEATGGDQEYLKMGGILDGLISRGWVAVGARAGFGWVSGDAPIQREYFLGGATTIRGFPPAILQGSQMGLGRLEVGVGPAVARIVGFGDVGWAGDSDRMPRSSSVGVGLSILEGVLRLDFAKPLKDGYGMKFYLTGSGLL